jgi:hypothetical protein
MFKSPNKIQLLPTFKFWRSQVLQNEDLQIKAQDILTEVSAIYPDIKALEFAPNLLPSRLETPFLGERMRQNIIILLALSETQTVFNIREISSSPNFKKDWLIIQETIRESLANYLALTIACTIAEYHSLRLDAAPGSRAERHGLFSSKHLSNTLTADQIATFHKLWRLFEVDSHQKDYFLQTKKFSHHLGLQVKAVGAHKNYSLKNNWQYFEPLFVHFKISPRNQHLLHFIFKNLGDWHRSNDHRAFLWFKALDKKAEKAGLDPSDAIDAFLAAIVTENVLNRLSLHHNEEYHFLNYIHTTFTNLHLAFQNNLEARQQKYDEIKRRKLKQALAFADINVIKLMDEQGIPFGPERGVYLNQVYQLINNPELSIPSNLTELAEKINLARSFLTKP